MFQLGVESDVEAPESILRRVYTFSVVTILEVTVFALCGHKLVKELLVVSIRLKIVCLEGFLADEVDSFKIALVLDRLANGGNLFKDLSVRDKTQSFFWRNRGCFLDYLLVS